MHGLRTSCASVCGLGGEGDIPHSGSSANIHHFYDVLEVGIGITTNSDGLITFHSGNGRELFEERGFAQLLTIHISRAIFANVDDDF